MLTKTQDHGDGCYWLAGWRSVGKVFGGDGFYDDQFNILGIIISFDSVVVVSGRTAGRPRVRSSSRPCAILPGTWLLEPLIRRGVVLVIAVEPRRFNRY